jgi:tetratricopeptide (TPR) repeat protein
VRNPNRIQPRAGAASLLLLAIVLGAFPAQAASPGQASLDSGVRHYKEGRYDAALTAFQRATELDPGLIRAWENLGWAYLKLDRSNDAVATWQRLLKLEPDNAALWSQIASARLAQKAWPEAIQALGEALRLQPDQPALRLRLAEAYENAGRQREARSQYEEWLAQRPLDLEAIFRLASFYARTGDEERAVALLRGASQRLPDLAHVFRVHLARVRAQQADRLYGEGHFDLAAERYREALELDPKNARRLMNYGWAERKRGHPAEAARLWEAALALDPQLERSYRAVADAKREEGDVAEARVWYEKAWEHVARREPGIAYHLAEIALSETDTPRAVIWLGRLFAFPKSDEEWSQRSASLFVRFERPDDGIAFFEQRYAHTTALTQTKGALARLHAARASAAARAANAEAAIRDFQAALRLDGASVAALRELGWVYWAQGAWADCEKTWEQYRALYAAYPEPHNLMTHLYLQKRAYKRAIASIRKSLSLKEDQPEQKLKLAKALFWDGQFADSRGLLEQLVAQSPDDLPTQLFWGEVLMRYNDFARGKEQWRRILALGSDSPKAQYYQLRSMYELGEYDAALAEARRIVESGNPQEALLRLLADDALLLEDAATATHWYEELTRHFPERLSSWLQLARLYQQRQDWAACRKALDEARRRFPNEFQPRIRLADLLQRTGHTAEAAEIFHSLAKQFPSNRDAYWGCLQTALASGQTAQALALLHENRRLFLKDYEVSLEMAHALYAAGKVSAAEDSLRQAAKGGNHKRYVPALLYHGLGTHSRSPSLPIELFDSQMKALRDAGYSPITLPELARMLDGAMPFASKPILITFDDARRDSFDLADPVLKRYAMRATMFTPTARVVDNDPFFADWRSILACQRNGRWDIQSHGHRAHDAITVGEREQLGGFLVNREWREDQQRLETSEEYEQRLDDDYRQSADEIRRYVPQAQPIGYAFPLSEVGQEDVGNEPSATETNERVLAKHFRFGFVQDQSGYNEVAPGTKANSILLRRMGVPRSWDGPTLLRHLTAQHPKNQALMELARVYSWSGQYAQATRLWQQLLRAEPLLQSEAEYQLATLSYHQEQFHDARRHLRAARRLDPERASDHDRLARALIREGGARIGPQTELHSDSDGRRLETVTAQASHGSVGPVDVGLNLGTLRLRETAQPSLYGTELAAHLRWRVNSHWTLATRARQRNMTAAPDSQNYWIDVRYENDRLDLTAQAAREDVDTRSALAIGLKSRAYSGSALLRLSSRWLLQLDAAHRRYEDTNMRESVSARLAYRPRALRGVHLGLGAGYSDTTLQSALYYTPEALQQFRAFVGFRRRSLSGWLVDTEAAGGWADDRLRGRRWTRQGYLRTGHAWGAHLLSTVEAQYSASPGYSGWGAGASLYCGF